MQVIISALNKIEFEVIFDLNITQRHYSFRLPTVNCISRLSIRREKVASAEKAASWLVQVKVYHCLD